MLAVADPDLEIRRRGRSFRPWGKRGAVSKNFLSALRASIWSKNEVGGGGALPLDPPLVSLNFIRLLRVVSSRRSWGHGRQEGCARSGSSTVFVARKVKILKAMNGFCITRVTDVLSVFSYSYLKCLHSWHSISNFRKIFVAEGNSYILIWTFHLSRLFAKRGFDCLCWSLLVLGPGHLTDLVLKGRIIWIFLRPTWRYLTADSDEKDWDWTYVSLVFPTSTLHACAVWSGKIWKSWRPTRQAKAGWISLFCLQISYHVF